jgi:hypothetical protein
MVEEKESTMDISHRLLGLNIRKGLRPDLRERVINGSLKIEGSRGIYG